MSLEGLNRLEVVEGEAAALRASPGTSGDATGAGELRCVRQRQTTALVSSGVADIGLGRQRRESRVRLHALVEHEDVRALVWAAVRLIGLEKRAQRRHERA